jgi:hypothetical protein
MAYGHKQCKSAVEVVEKETFDRHTHGNITRGGKISGVTAPMLIVTDAQGNIVAATTIDADITIHGTLTADKVIGAVYA